LFSVLHGLECGADRNLGLAEADVTTNESIHRHCPFHVALHLGDRAALVESLDVRKGGLHVVLPWRVDCKGVPLGGDATLIQNDKFLGDLLNGRAHLRFGAREVGTAEAVHGRRFAADVLANRVDLIGRHVQLVAALVGEQQVVALCAADRAADETLELADTVVVVNDVVAGLQVLECGARSARLLATRPGSTSGQVGLGDECELRAGHERAMVQSLHRDEHARSDGVASCVGHGSRG